jgi:hypothetical protein
MFPMGFHLEHFTASDNVIEAALPIGLGRWAKSMTLVGFLAVLFFIKRMRKVGGNSGQVFTYPRGVCYNAFG